MNLVPRQITTVCARLGELLVKLFNRRSPMLCSETDVPDSPPCDRCVRSLLPTDEGLLVHMGPQEAPTSTNDYAREHPVEPRPPARRRSGGFDVVFQLGRQGRPHEVRHELVRGGEEQVFVFVADIKGCVRAVGDPWRDQQRAGKRLWESRGWRRCWGRAPCRILAALRCRLTATAPVLSVVVVGYRRYGRRYGVIPSWTV